MIGGRVGCFLSTCQRLAQRMSSHLAESCARQSFSASFATCEVAACEALERPSERSAKLAPSSRHLQRQRVGGRAGEVGLDAVNRQDGVLQCRQLGVLGDQVRLDLGEAGEPVADEDVLPDRLWR